LIAVFFFHLLDPAKIAPSGSPRPRSVEPTPLVILSERVEMLADLGVEFYFRTPSSKHTAHFPENFSNHFELLERIEPTRSAM